MNDDALWMAAPWMLLPRRGGLIAPARVDSDRNTVFNRLVAKRAANQTAAKRALSSAHFPVFPLEEVR